MWLFVMLPVAESQRGAPISPTAPPIKPTSPRSNAPKPFHGLTHTPHCALWARETAPPQAPPPVPPDPLAPTPRRPREVDPSMPFCPHSAGDYRGGLGRGKLRANGHPRGGPWRQCHWTSCAGSFLETPGPLFHGTQAAVELIVRVFAGWAAALGSRATARGVEVDAHTGWQWGGAAAEQLRAFSASFLCA